MKRYFKLVRPAVLAAGFAALVLLPGSAQALIGNSPLQPVAIFCVAQKSATDLSIARAMCDAKVAEEVSAELIGGSPLAFLRPCIDQVDGLKSGDCSAVLDEVILCDDIKTCEFFLGFDTLSATRAPTCDSVKETADSRLWVCFMAKPDPPAPSE